MDINMIKRYSLCKILAVGIIVLFMGVSVSSGFALDTNQSIRVNQSEDCEECQEITKADLVLVKQLINRVDICSRLLLTLSRIKPGINDISIKIDETISFIKNQIEYEDICDFLYIVHSCFFIIAGIFGRLAEEFEDNLFLFNIFYLQVLILYPFLVVINELGYRYNCDFWYWPS